MGMSADDYLAQLQALLPPGAAWTREPDADLTRLLHAFADALARIDARAEDLLREADPREALELLPEWLRAFGLPDDCTPADGFDTLAEQRALLVQRVTARGGATAQYVIGVAANIGFAITIEELRPARFGQARFGRDFFAPAETVFVFYVHAPATTVRLARFGNARFGESFGESSPNLTLECAVNRVKPAHLVAYFKYGV